MDKQLALYYKIRLTLVISMGSSEETLSASGFPFLLSTESSTWYIPVIMHHFFIYNEKYFIKSCHCYRALFTSLEMEIIPYIFAYFIAINCITNQQRDRNLLHSMQALDNDLYPANKPLLEDRQDQDQHWSTGNSCHVVLLMQLLSLQLILFCNM